MLVLLFLIPLLLLGFYAYQAIKTITKKRWIRLTYLIFCGVVFLDFFTRLIVLRRSEALEGSKAYSFGLVLTIATAQLVLVIFMFGEDIIRFFKALFSKRTTSSRSLHLPSRRRFISQLALGVAAIPFSSLLYGMVKGKYDFRVLSYELEFEDLPEAFDGYTITQISDIHCGSFDSKKQVAYGVDLIKDQQSDVIFFTGDLVNNLSEELEGWKDLFGSISAPDGVFSILGNHDYGDYYHWDSEADKEANLDQLKILQAEMGWDLLLNENRRIERDGQYLNIVGVENWGNGGFPKYGDEDKAAGDLSSKDFKILLSHDPSHWQEKIQTDERNYQLTLSGHTHGMQFGVEIPGVIKWSPVKYRYKYWAGIYKEHGRYIHVNRGFGYLGYPGRVGMWPEVTVIRLKKKRTG